MRIVFIKLNTKELVKKMKWIIRFVCLFIASCLILMIGVDADKISNARDNMTRLSAGVASNHEINFQTLAGVDASTDTIVITFDSGFDLSGIGFADVDLFSGATTGLENEKNLGSTVGSARWGLGITSQVMTFTPPTDAVAGEVEVNDYVVIRIGTNSSGGVNQIVNPGSADVYSIGVNGNFGDVGSIYIPIISSDAVSVAAQVVSDDDDEEEEGGGGPLIEDDDAPIIEKVRIKNITSNSVKVIWQTSEMTTGVLEYGLDTTYGTEVEDLENLFLIHNFNLMPLKQETEYHFRIDAEDQSGNAIEKKDYLFRTLAVSNAFNFKAHGFDKQILLEWQNPEMENMAGVRIVRSEKKYIESPDEGLVIYEGPGVSFLDKDVVNGAWYFYTIFVYDTTRQYSTGAISSAVPLAKGEIIPPKPGDIEKMDEIIEGLRFIDLEFRVANEALRIYPDDEKNVKVLSRSLLSVLLQQNKVIKKLKTIIAQVGDSSYLLKINKQKGKYQTLISTPVEIGSYPIVVLVVVYEDGSKDTVRGNLIVENYGIVKGLPVAKAGEAKAGWYSEKVNGVSIALFEKNYDDEVDVGGKWEIWNGGKYFQHNPQITDQDGEYGFMAPNGKYYLALSKDGYKDSVTPEFEITDNLINWDLKLDRIMKKRWYLRWGIWTLIGLLALFIILFWKRRRRRKEEEEKKRKEGLKKVIV